jgi:maltooligosyltrehalose trehalohydrolase
MLIENQSNSLPAGSDTHSDATASAEQNRAPRPQPDAGARSGGHGYRFGPATGGTETVFRLWAPGQKRVALVTEGAKPRPMEKAADGFWTLPVADCSPGTRYRFKAGGLEFPDPAARQQSGGTVGWSVVRAPMPPSGRREPLRPWHEAVHCEVHVGTATPEGTFNALAERLEHFADAGYTTLELLPVNAFPGNRNWGYDGTLVFAPAEAYGTPDELRALVDRAHAVGLCMVLDVVYNHFGEADNFLLDYCPEWFAKDVNTPWGPGIDFRQEMVRRFYYENATMWLSEYDFDGLRFDAVHEMGTEASDRFLRELAAAARSVKPDAKLIIENVANEASWLTRGRNEVPVHYTAQWNDDFHHVAAFLLTGERKFGYEEADRDPIADLEKALADGFVHDGEAEGESDGTTRDEPASRLPADAFVHYLQNHDMIGNRTDSARLPLRIDARRLDFYQFVLLLSPQAPLFFMGDEAHLRTPFPYFFDVGGKVADKKRKQRYRDMKEMFHEQVEDGGLPDPAAHATFEAAKIDWADFARPEHSEALARFRELAALRREIVWPLLASGNVNSWSARQGDGIIVTWEFRAGFLSMALNPTAHPIRIDCWMCDRTISSGGFRRNGNCLELEPWTAIVWRN